MPIVPNPNFRPNPERCIYIDSRIDEALVLRLTPTILKLQHKSRLPITAYILSSPGGNVEQMETILRLLRSPNQDVTPPCKVITVVTKRAASAAADLLCSGDYAIAHPDSTILYHGGRTFENRPLTAQFTSVLSVWLRLSSDKYAWELAKKIEDRFMFLFVTQRSKFAEIRKKPGKAAMSDFDCYVEIIMGHLSPDAKKICQTAKDRYGRYEAMLKKLSPKGKGKKRQSAAKIEARYIRTIVDFEIEENKANPNFTYNTTGMMQLLEDFHVLTEYLAGTQHNRLVGWCKRYGVFALNDAERIETEKIADENLRNDRITEIVRPILQPVWSFFVALCHALQEGENELTAKDAYWLGLIDEVLGDSDGFPMRLLFEQKPDPPAPKAEPEVKADGSQDQNEKKEEAASKDTLKPLASPAGA